MSNTTLALLGLLFTILIALVRLAPDLVIRVIDTSHARFAAWRRRGYPLLGRSPGRHRAEGPPRILRAAAQ